MVELHSSVHVGAFLLIVTGSLHHVLWVAEQSQVHQLVVQTSLLFRHKSTDPLRDYSTAITMKVEHIERIQSCF